MLSTLGRCHTFDRKADGYCRGEGCCAYILEQQDVLKDPAIAASFQRTAVQQDGPSASLTAPNGSSQRRLLNCVNAFLDHSAVSNSDVSLEAHGTGTALGDPIEIGAAVDSLC